MIQFQPQNGFSRRASFEAPPRMRHVFVIRGPGELFRGMGEANSVVGDGMLDPFDICPIAEAEAFDPNAEGPSSFLDGAPAGCREWEPCRPMESPRVLIALVPPPG